MRELAYMIVEELECIQQNNINKNSVKICILHCCSKINPISFLIIPKKERNTGILVKYNNLLFDCYNIDIFKDVTIYILDIINKIINDLLEIIVNNGEWELNPEDGETDEYFLKIEKEDKQIYISNGVGCCSVFYDAIKPMYYLCSVNTKIKELGQLGQLGQ